MLRIFYAIIRDGYQFHRFLPGVAPTFAGRVPAAQDFPTHSGAGEVGLAFTAHHGIDMPVGDISTVTCVFCHVCLRRGSCHLTALSTQYTRSAPHGQWHFAPCGSGKTDVDTPQVSPVRRWNRAPASVVPAGAPPPPAPAAR